MSEHLLAQLHHFQRQSYKDTLDYFRGKTRIHGRNPGYAARLEFVRQGHMDGGTFGDLVSRAITTFPFAGE